MDVSKAKLKIILILNFFPCSRNISTVLTTRYTVIEEKLVAFLQMCVIGRKSKKAKDQEIGQSSNLAYRNVIIGLHMQLKFILSVSKIKN